MVVAVERKRERERFQAVLGRVRIGKRWREGRREM